jgi:hypothetical protein
MLSHIYEKEISRENAKAAKKSLKRTQLLVFLVVSQSSRLRVRLS